MPGDYNKLRMCYVDRSVDSTALTSTDYSGTPQTTIACRSTEHQIFVQKIIVSPTTYAAKTWTFRDSAGTPVPNGVVSIPAAAPTAGGDVNFVIDFGPVGYALTQGKDLQFLMSAAGAAGAVHVEAYERLAAGAHAQAAVGAKTN